MFAQAQAQVQVQELGQGAVVHLVFEYLLEELSDVCEWFLLLLFVVLYLLYVLQEAEKREDANKGLPLQPGTDAAQYLLHA